MKKKSLLLPIFIIYQSWGNECNQILDEFNKSNLPKQVHKISRRTSEVQLAASLQKNTILTDEQKKSINQLKIQSDSALIEFENKVIQIKEQFYQLFKPCKEMVQGEDQILQIFKNIVSLSKIKVIPILHIYN